jgi:hypothetical protein
MSSLWDLLDDNIQENILSYNRITVPHPLAKIYKNKINELVEDVHMNVLEFNNNHLTNVLYTTPFDLNSVWYKLWFHKLVSNILITFNQDKTYITTLNIGTNVYEFDDVYD